MVLSTFMLYREALRKGGGKSGHQTTTKGGKKSTKSGTTNDNFRETDLHSSKGKPDRLSELRERRAERAKDDTMQSPPQTKPNMPNGHAGDKAIGERKSRSATAKSKPVDSDDCEGNIFHFVLGCYNML